MADDEVYPDSGGQQYNPEPTPAYEQTKALQGYSSGLSLGSLRNPPVRKVVEAQIAELKLQIAEREKLLASLDEVPVVEKILDSMRKLSI